jgi:hypothetical protein
MEKLINQTALWVKMATDILLAKNPHGTSVGILAGVFFHGVLIFISPIFWIVQNAIKAGFNIFYSVCGGMLVFNIKPFMTRHKPPREIEEALELIKQQKKERLISDQQAKLQCASLVTKYIESIQLTEKIQKKTRRGAH